MRLRALWRAIFPSGKVRLRNPEVACIWEVPFLWGGLKGTPPQAVRSILFIQIQLSSVEWSLDCEDHPSWSFAHKRMTRLA
jgi:hypothetical protein